MAMKHILLMILILGSCRLCFSQSNRQAETACTVAGHTDASELAVVCRQASSGTCYRLSGPVGTQQFTEGTAVWMDFEPAGIRITDAIGRSVARLKASKTIPLNSRQWPWFGPVSQIVCSAGREADH
jgi:hypothetical protein